MQLTNRLKELGWNLEYTYLSLPSKFHESIAPTPVASPRILLFNKELAESLDSKFDSSDLDTYAQILSGNIVIGDNKTFAQAYAGHQFGHFTMLGDGRAIILGEHVTNENKRFDIQLKGAGETPFSRRGDGRATLSSMLREYLISEALFHLGIPTTRSLAVVATGEKVARENWPEGGILTRVASSHIRVGTFEYASHMLGLDELKSLTHYSILRHYPTLLSTENPPLELLKTVMNRQIDLVINWMRVGFIHGVMNTDNTTISGETIDYGPCAFMNTYHPKTVFSSIDRNGRYAFEKQAPIIQWNMMCLAESLLPLLHDDKQIAIDLAQQVLSSFSVLYEERYLTMMRSKLGFSKPFEGDLTLINDLLDWMEINQVDYTTTFLQLEREQSLHTGIYLSATFQEWLERWKSSLTQNGISFSQATELLQKTNPAYIPRNKYVEEALEKASTNDMDMFNQMIKILSNPYSNRNKYTFLQESDNNDLGYQTFCGT
jgi:serine/tyrosine/threonine adenylyltransferase